jgi:hypothetical protein
MRSARQCGNSINLYVRAVQREREGVRRHGARYAFRLDWADAGFTPSVQILRQLLPICHENNTGSGASSEKIAQDLTLSVELKDQQYLIPRLDLS